MNLLTTTVARLLFGIPLIFFGLTHFMKAGQMAGMVPFPPETFWVYLTGAAHILAALAIIINKFGKVASLLLALMLLIFILSIHAPSVAEQGMSAMQGLLKDTMIMAGALAMAGIFARNQA